MRRNFLSGRRLMYLQFTCSFIVHRSQGLQRLFFLLLFSVSSLMVALPGIKRREITENRWVSRVRPSLKFSCLDETSPKVAVYEGCPRILRCTTTSRLLVRCRSAAVNSWTALAYLFFQRQRNMRRGVRPFIVLGLSDGPRNC